MDNSSIYLTKGQTIQIEVVSKNMDTFYKSKKDKISIITANDTLKIPLTKDDLKRGADSNTTIIPSNDKEIYRIRQGDKENISGESTLSDNESDQVFTHINSPKYIAIQPTSDPTYSDSQESATNSTLIEEYKGYLIKKRVSLTNFGESTNELFIDSVEEGIEGSNINIDITGESDALESLKFTIDLKIVNSQTRL